MSVRARLLHRHRYAYRNTLLADAQVYRAAHRALASVPSRVIAPDDLLLDTPYEVELAVGFDRVVGHRVVPTSRAVVPVGSSVLMISFIPMCRTCVTPWERCRTSMVCRL